MKLQLNNIFISLYTTLLYLAYPALTIDHAFFMIIILWVVKNLLQKNASLSVILHEKRNWK